MIKSAVTLFQLIHELSGNLAFIAGNWHSEKMTRQIAPLTVLKISRARFLGFVGFCIPEPILFAVSGQNKVKLGLIKILLKPIGRLQIFDIFMYGVL